MKTPLKGKILFKGSFLGYFMKAIFILLLVVCTAGLALPYFLYWTNKYFFDNLEIEIKESKE